MGLFDLSIDAGLQLLERRVKLQHLPVPNLCVVQTLCRLMQALIDFMHKNGGFGDADAAVRLFAKIYQVQQCHNLTYRKRNKPYFSFCINVSSSI